MLNTKNCRKLPKTFPVVFGGILSYATAIKQ